MHAILQPITTAEHWDGKAAQDSANTQLHEPEHAVETTGDEPWSAFCQRLTKPVLLLASADQEASE